MTISLARTLHWKLEEDKREPGTACMAWCVCVELVRV